MKPQRLDRPLPTRRAVAAALAVALAAFLAPAPAAVVVLGNLLLLLLWGLDTLAAAAPARFGVERSLPGIVGLGTEGTVRWRVTNPTGRAQHVWVSDDLAPGLGPERRRFALRLPGGGAASAAAVLRPVRRGRFEPVEVVVRVAGPLGLGARQRRRALPGTVKVYPPFRSRDEAELRIDRGRILEVGLRSAAGRGTGTDFDQLREYTPDDESRRIDWPATARSTRTIVRTYRSERNQNVLVLLDNGRVMAGRVGGVPRVEHAMDATLLLTYLATRLGDRVGMLAFEDRVRSVVPPSHQGSQMARVADAMYDLEPALRESDYRGAFTEALVRFRRRALLVVLTELDEQAVGETLLPALPLLLRRHLVVFGSVRDPEVEAWAVATPAGAAEAYRKAAAVLALDERARLAARLRGMGVVVVDAVPGRLAPGLGDAYLHAKATARL